MTLGEKIQQLRKTKGMSQEQLAAQLTISRQAISKWELNESIPDTENIIQLSKLFGVATDYLLNDEIESDMDIPAVQESRDKLAKQYNRKIWVVLILSICLVSIVVGFINRSLSAAIVGVIFIGAAYIVMLIIKTIKKYTAK